MLLAAVLRFFRIGYQSLWADEGNSAAMAGRSLAEISARAAADIHPPGYYWLLNLWSRIFGDSEAALRALSAVWGILLVWLVYQIVSRLFDRRTALIAAFFAAINPFLIYLQPGSAHVRPVGRAGRAALLRPGALHPARVDCAASRWNQQDHVLLRPGHGRHSVRRGGRPVHALHLPADGRRGYPALRAVAVELAAARLRSGAPPALGHAADRHGLLLPALVRHGLGSTDELAAQRAGGAAGRCAGAGAGRAGPGAGQPHRAGQPVAGGVPGAVHPGAVAVGAGQRPAGALAELGAAAAVAGRARGPGAAGRPVQAGLHEVPAGGRGPLHHAAGPRRHRLHGGAGARPMEPARGHACRASRRRSGRNAPPQPASAAAPSQPRSARCWPTCGWPRPSSWSAFPAASPWPATTSIRPWRATTTARLRAYISAVAGPDDAIILNAPGQREVFEYYYQGPLPIYDLPEQRPPDEAATLARIEEIAGQHPHLYTLYWATEESDPDRLDRRLAGQPTPTKRKIAGRATCAS